MGFLDSTDNIETVASTNKIQCVVSQYDLLCFRPELPNLVVCILFITAAKISIFQPILSANLQ